MVKKNARICGLAGAAVAVVALAAMPTPAFAADSRTGSHTCASTRTVGVTISVLGGGASADSHNYTSSGQSWSKNFVGGGQHTSASPFHSAAFALSTNSTYAGAPAKGCYN